MAKARRQHIEAYGIKVLLSGHPDVRRLKRRYEPSVHGNKFWTSSWLIMDFLQKQGLPKGTRVMEIGCGWGLAGIFCAETFGAQVTGIDIDPDVFPYLHLHAEINNVEISTFAKGFDDVRLRDLENIDLLIGADICFWDEMVSPLKRFVRRALRAGVQQVLIADPGRSPFEALAKNFVGGADADNTERSVSQPRSISGKLLRIGTIGR